MRVSLRMIGFVFLWCCFVLALGRLAYTELANPNSWASFIPSDTLEFFNFFFALSVLLIALGRGAKEFFWVGVATVAVTLVAAQIFEALPQQAVKRVAYWLIESVPTKTQSSAGQETHADQIASLLLYSWIPLVSFFGGYFARWWRLEPSSRNGALSDSGTMNAEPPETRFQGQRSTTRAQ